MDQGPRTPLRPARARGDGSAREERSTHLLTVRRLAVTRLALRRAVVALRGAALLRVPALLLRVPAAAVPVLLRALAVVAVCCLRLLRICTRGREGVSVRLGRRE